MSDEVEYLLGRLGSEEAKQRATTLRGLAASETPVADAQVLAACERLLDDRTMTLLSIPYSYGEVRWLAADAVAKLRGALGLTEPVRIEDVFAPCSGDAVTKLAREAGLPEDFSGHEGIIATLEQLAALDRLPRRTITRTP